FVLQLHLHSFPTRRSSDLASNGVFGDPCNGTVKRLYVQVTYSTTLPLRLVGFNGFINNAGKVELGWSTEDEVNFSHFIIERSEEDRKSTRLNSSHVKISYA